MDQKKYRIRVIIEETENCKLVESHTVNEYDDLETAKQGLDILLTDGCAKN